MIVLSLFRVQTHLGTDVLLCLEQDLIDYIHGRHKCLKKKNKKINTPKVVNVLQKLA